MVSMQPSAIFLVGQYSTGGGSTIPVSSRLEADVPVRAKTLISIHVYTFWKHLHSFLLDTGPHVELPGGFSIPDIWCLLGIFQDSSPPLPPSFDWYWSSTSGGHHHHAFMEGIQQCRGQEGTWPSAQHLAPGWAGATLCRGVHVGLGR